MKTMYPPSGQPYVQQYLLGGASDQDPQVQAHETQQHQKPTAADHKHNDDYRPGYDYPGPKNYIGHMPELGREGIPVAAVDYLTREELSRCYKRFCEEVNWDFIYENKAKFKAYHEAQNEFAGGGMAFEKFWCVLLTAYNYYVQSKGLRIDPILEITVDYNRSDMRTNCLNEVRTMIQDAYSIFAPISDSLVLDFEFFKDVLSGGKPHVLKLTTAYIDVMSRRLEKMV